MQVKWFMERSGRRGLPQRLREGPAAQGLDQPLAAAHGIWELTLGGSVRVISLPRRRCEERGDVGDSKATVTAFGAVMR
jgi:hypothetical protein